MNHTSYEILLPFVLRQIILCCRSRFVFDQTIIKMNESFVIHEILRFFVVWSHSANNVQRESSDTVQVTLQPFVSLPRRMSLPPSRQPRLLCVVARASRTTPYSIRHSYNTRKARINSICRSLYFLICISTVTIPHYLITLGGFLT